MAGGWFINGIASLAMAMAGVAAQAQQRQDAHDVVAQSQSTVASSPWSSVPVTVGEPAEDGGPDDAHMPTPDADVVTKSVLEDGTVLIHLNGAGMERMQVLAGRDGRLRAACSSVLESRLRRTSSAPDDFRRPHAAAESRHALR